MLIHYVKGTYQESGKDYIIVDNNGMGIKIFVPTTTLGKSWEIGQTIKFYTYFHIREDIMALYGFLSKEELDMFELLISVSGVGPKAGLAVLSTLSPAKLGFAILGADIKSLKSVPGIGEKTARRILLELKDKIDKDGIYEIENDIIEVDNNAAGEAVRALMALGYNTNEANSAVRTIDVNSKDTEEIIKAALKKLMR